MTAGPVAPVRPSYAAYKAAIAHLPMPLAAVDLDAFDANVAAIARRAAGMPIRVASKSVRCVALLKRIMASGPAYRGLMAYHALEAVHLADAGFDDLLIAYPFVHPAHVEAVCGLVARGVTVTAMVDEPAQVKAIASVASRLGVTLGLAIDLDMSMSLPGLHFGVRRSPVTSPAQALELAAAIAETPGVRLDGLMGYEAQIAGVPDAAGAPTDVVVRLLKSLSRKEVADRRSRVVKALEDAGHVLRFVNGGGTGSIESTIAESAVTEVTAGSGFYAPALFDGYEGFRHHPAAFYAVEITRRPTAGVYTCLGGGYPASGSADPNKAPSVFLPEGASLLPLEGAGEVQTPVRYLGPEPLGLGDPIFLRHAKAGELCERFEALHLIAGGQVVDKVPTYRGEGRCFL